MSVKGTSRTANTSIGSMRVPECDAHGMHAHISYEDVFYIVGKYENQE